MNNKFEGIAEMCGECSFENVFDWDFTDGHMIHCLQCGHHMPICNMCTMTLCGTCTGGINFQLTGAMNDLIRKAKKQLSDFDADNAEYNYDEMKIISVLCKQKVSHSLDYEQLCEAAKAIYGIWADGIDNQTIAGNELLQFKTHEEEGYAQAYAERIGTQFIKEYFQGEIDNV